MSSSAAASLLLLFRKVLWEPVSFMAWDILAVPVCRSWMLSRLSLLIKLFLVNIKASYIFSFHSVQIELPGHLGIVWEWVWPFNHPFPVISLLMSQSGLSRCYHRNLTTAISLILLFLIPSPGPNLQRLAETIIIPPKSVFLSRASSETGSMLDEPTWDLYIWLAKLQIFLFLWISGYNASIVIVFDFQPQ